MIQRLKLNKDQADYIVDYFGECWLNSDENLIYLAPIIDPEDSSGQTYLIEKGVKKKNGVGTDFLLTLSEIPSSCRLSQATISKYDFPEEIAKEINENKRIPVVEKTIGDIEPQNVKGLKIRPMVSGIETSANLRSNKPGTLGAFLTLKNYSRPNELFFITNHHVVATYPLTRFDPIFQPDNTKHDYVNYIGQVWFGQYWRNEISEYDLDVAFVKLNANMINEQLTFGKEILYSSGNLIDNDRPNSNPTILDKETPEYGMEVYINGMTSIRSDLGIIRSTNLMVKVTNSYVTDKKDKKDKKIFRKQLLLNSISKSGDSGSVLIHKDTRKAVGLIHAGDNRSVSVANNIDHIFNNEYFLNKPGKFSIQLNKFIT